REDKDGNGLPGARGIGDIPIRDVTLTQLETWRNDLVADGARSKSTANRIMTTVKALLNHSFRDEANHITTNVAWRRLMVFKGLGTSREEHFSADEVLRLIEAAKTHPLEGDGPEGGQAFADLCEAAYLTGCRYGELSACDLHHFHAKREQLAIP